jgi:phospholipase C
MVRPTRRIFLGGAAAVAAAVLAACSPSKKKAAGSSGSVAASTATTPGARTGTIKDVKHVVILMQENRSFDHYFGALAGVRGLADQQQLRFANGISIFEQPDPSRGTSGTLSPWHMDTTKVDGQEAGDLDHGWPKTHQAWNQGAWNQWIAAKTQQTMGYFTRADIPWQYALADAFTICDAYHCSIQGPTTPNRLYHWTGTIDPGGRAGGPAIDNPPDYQPVYSWTTYPERLQMAGVSWQIYANDEVGDNAGADGWVGDYGDNPLWLFQAYHDALASTDPKQQQLASRASLRKKWKPDSGQGKNVDHVLAQFIGDCASGDLPTVSWIVAPYQYSEHPRARPVDGANYVGRVLKALWANPALWESTAVIINYDENDGYFDHALPPFAAPGTAGEYVQDLPIGLGPRVPMLVVSPWSHGGWVNSQVFDHTSVLRFLEVLTGVAEPNISAWRREICGDLTTCFDFSSFDASVPALPDIANLLTQANAERRLPAPTAPGVGAAPAPVVETGTRKYRPLPYQPNATVTVDRTAATIKVTLTNAGRSAVALSIYANIAGKAMTATPMVVPARGQAGYTPVTSAGGQYDFSIYGPNGFVRRCVGAVVPAAQNSAGVPSVQATFRGSNVVLALHNDGGGSLWFTLSPNDFGGQLQSIDVGAGASQTVSWPSTDGWYDVSVGTNGSNGANPATAFSYRFAGRIETG